jgi:hypothetical protein
MLPRGKAFDTTRKMIQQEAQPSPRLYMDGYVPGGRSENISPHSKG